MTTAPPLATALSTARSRVASSPPSYTTCWDTTREVPAGFVNRLDTPPSPDRHHPVSTIASASIYQSEKLS